MSQQKDDGWFVWMLVLVFLALITPLMLVISSEAIITVVAKETKPSSQWGKTFWVTGCHRNGSEEVFEVMERRLGPSRSTIFANMEVGKSYKLTLKGFKALEGRKIVASVQQQ